MPPTPPPPQKKKNTQKKKKYTKSSYQLGPRYQQIVHFSDTPSQILKFKPAYTSILNISENPPPPPPHAVVFSFRLMCTFAGNSCHIPFKGAGPLSNQLAVNMIMNLINQSYPLFYLICMQTLAPFSVFVKLINVVKPQFFISMAKVNIVNVVVLDNPSPFPNPFQFEITFEALEDLSEGKSCFNFHPIVQHYTERTGYRRTPLSIGT